MKKISLYLLLIISLISFNIKAEAVSYNTPVKGNMTYNECLNFQESAITTSGNGYFGHCIKATCYSGIWQTQYYISSNMVTCANGNKNYFRQIMADGCSLYSGSCTQTAYPKYCSLISYYDCSKTTGGNTFNETKTFTVSFNSNGGSSNPSSQSCTTTSASCIIDLNSAKPTRSGYNFLGWSEANACSDNKTVSASYAASRNISLSACWQAKPTQATTKKPSTPGTTTTTTPVVKSTNNYLSTLTINPGEINFSKITESYKLEITEEITSIEVVAIPEDEKATVVIENHETLNIDTPIKITVTAEDGGVRIYTIDLNYPSAKKDSNARLMFIEIDDYDLKFDPEIYNYDLKINKEAKLEINAETESDKAELRIVGNSNLSNNSKIQIIVTAEDGTEVPYVITIKKSNANIVGPIVVIIVLGMAVFVGIKLFRKMFTKKSEDSSYEYE